MVLELQSNQFLKVPAGIKLNDWHFKQVILLERRRVFDGSFSRHLECLFDSLDSFVFDQKQRILLALPLNFHHKGVIRIILMHQNLFLLSQNIPIERIHLLTVEEEQVLSSLKFHIEHDLLEQVGVGNDV